MGLNDVFADVFVARDGDATTAALVILAAGFAFVLITGAVFCHWRRAKRKKVLARQLAELRDFTALNRQDLDRLASDEDKMAAVINGVLERVLPDPEPARPELRVVR